MTGFVLLFAVACLGGVIATVGDRIGMKVGKSRLSLFNLRPRQTATVVSVATGMIASFSTLMLMIALDPQLRRGLFQLDEIQADLALAQQDLESTEAEKVDVETTLKKSTQLQREARARLIEINDSLQTAVAREEETLNRFLETQSELEGVSEQANSLRDEINGLRDERKALVEEQAQVLGQIAQRDQEISQRNQQLSERDQELSQRNQQLSERDQEIVQRSEELSQVNTELSQRDSQIAQRDEEIAERESRLADLQTQQTFLTEEIRNLEGEFQRLRLGSIVVGRNQAISVVTVRTNSAEEARRKIEDALLSANYRVVQQILPDQDVIDKPVIRYDTATVQQILSSITDAQNYAIVVSSAANYIVGEPCVNAVFTQGGEPCLQVNVAAVVNRVQFQQGEALVSARLGRNVDIESFVERFSLLRQAADFQAQRSGVIDHSPVVANGFLDPVLEFYKKVQAYGEPVEIQLIASQPILTTGPVFLDIAAVKDGQILFRTRDSDQ